MKNTPAELDALVRKTVYDSILTRGEVPQKSALAAQMGLAPDEVSESFQRLADAHVLVLGADGEVRMANPFSAAATRFKVRAGTDEWWANCIWDALGVGVMIRREAVVESHCPDCGESLILEVTQDGPRASQAVAHFAVPAAQWWDDIVFT